MRLLQYKYTIKHNLNQSLESLHGVRSVADRWLQQISSGHTAPKPLKLTGNVNEHYRKFEEHWTLVEKTELKDKSKKRNARTSYSASERKDVKFTKP